MPCNDQMIRQLHLLRELKSLRGKTLQELASALPKDYARHERTVRRDLEALEAAGFPLITETINGENSGAGTVAGNLLMAAKTTRGHHTTVKPGLVHTGKD